MVDLIVTEAFKRDGRRFDKGAIISDPEMVAWVLKNKARHVMRRASPGDVLSSIVRG
jgi:hypothetical protein